MQKIILLCFAVLAVAKGNNNEANQNERGQVNHYGSESGFQTAKSHGGEIRDPVGQGTGKYLSHENQLNKETVNGYAGTIGNQDAEVYVDYKTKKHVVETDKTVNYHRNADDSFAVPENLVNGNSFSYSSQLPNQNGRVSNNYLSPENKLKTGNSFNYNSQLPNENGLVNNNLLTPGNELNAGHSFSYSSQLPSQNGHVNSNYLAPENELKAGHSFSYSSQLPSQNGHVNSNYLAPENEVHNNGNVLDGNDRNKPNFYKEHDDKNLHESGVVNDNLFTHKNENPNLNTNTYDSKYPLPVTDTFSAELFNLGNELPGDKNVNSPHDYSAYNTNNDLDVKESNNKPNTNGYDAKYPNHIDSHLSVENGAGSTLPTDYLSLGNQLQGDQPVNSLADYSTYNNNNNNDWDVKESNNKPNTNDYDAKYPDHIDSHLSVENGAGSTLPTDYLSLGNELQGDQPVNSLGDYSTYNHNNNDWDVKEYYNNARDGLQDRTDDYVSSNRRQYLKLLQHLEKQIKFFETDYLGRLEGLNLVENMVAATIVHNEEVLNPLEVLGLSGSGCVKTHRSLLMSEAEARREIKGCVTNASLQAKDLLSHPRKIKNIMEKYYHVDYRKNINNCNKDPEYTSCVITATYKANEFMSTNKKAFKTALEVDKCAANANIDAAAYCSYLVQNRVQTLISKVNELTGKCIAGKRECEKCSGYECDNIADVSGHQMAISPRLENPLYGNKSQLKCVYLNVK